MNKILIIDDEEEIRELLEIVIESRFDCPIVKLATAEDAILYMESFHDIALIVCDYSLFRSANGSIVYQFNKEHNNHPFLFLTGTFVMDDPILFDFETSNRFNRVFSKPLDEEPFLEHISSIFQNAVSDSPIAAISSEGYRRVKLQTFVQNFISGIDLNIKLSSKKYLKIFGSDDKVAVEDLLKYQDKGLDYLYLSERDYKIFSEKYINALELNLIPGAGQASSRSAIASAIDFVNQTVVQLGIPPEQIKLVDTCVKASIDELKKTDIDKHIIEAFNKDSGYLVAHSLLSLHFSYVIVKKMNILSDVLVSKLSYAAILHDLALPASNLSEYFDMKTPAFNKLSWNEKEAIRTHTSQMYSIISKMNNMLPDVGTIVHEHHERPDGSGFPRGLASTVISPLSAIFILSLKMADFFYHNEITADSIADLRSHLENTYNKGNFRKPLSAVFLFIDSIRLS